MPARIAIIEDNPTNLSLMCYLIRAYGHEVLQASDGAQGLELVRRESPDLVLCDLQVPIMDGFEVARSLRTHPALKAIPIVAVTAFAMVGDRDRVLAGGFDGYIAKPIDPEIFVSQVETFLSPGKRSTGVAIEPPPAPESGSGTVRRPRILAVDDSPVNLMLLSSTLEPFGFEIVAARTIAEGLEMARRDPPDLILSDIHMSGGDGYAFVGRVKAEPALRAIPFVFISSTLQPGFERKEGIARGADAFILRPIEPLALVSEIRACLEGRGGRPA